MRPERARNMAAKILRKPARSIVSVDIEQLLMPFRAAKQPVWHCNMARLAGLYGPFGIAGPRPAACQPVGQCAHSRAHRSLSAGCGACRAAVAGLMCGFRLHVAVVPCRRHGCAPVGGLSFRGAAADAFPVGLGAEGIRPPVATGQL